MHFLSFVESVYDVADCPPFLGGVFVRTSSLIAHPHLGPTQSFISSVWTSWQPLTTPQLRFYPPTIPMIMQRPPITTLKRLNQTSVWTRPTSTPQRLYRLSPFLWLYFSTSRVCGYIHTFSLMLCLLANPFSHGLHFISTKSGGTFGIEPVVKAAGNFYAILGIALMPFFWSLPEMFMTYKMSIKYPCASGVRVNGLQIFFMLHSRSCL